MIGILAALVGLGDFSSGAKAVLQAKIHEGLGNSAEVSTVKGVVTYAGDDRFYLQDGDAALKVVCDNAPLPAVGETVAAAGVPALEGGHVVLVARQWKSEGAAELPAARPAEKDELIYAGEHGVNWRRIVITGRAFETTERGFAMDVDGVPVTVMVDDPPWFIRECGRLRPLVKVTGVVELLLDQGVLFGREAYVMGIKMSAVSAADLVLKPDATYLLNRRTLAVRLAIGATILLLAAGLVVFLVIIFRQRRRHFRTATLMAERKRMADDIHDTIEQHLVGAGMLIQLNRNKEAMEVLKRAKSELRDIIWGLKNDDMMRLTPAEMLRETAEKETKKGIFRVTTKITGMPARMPTQQLRDLSLIVREAIGNAVKHGGAKKIAITSDPQGKDGWLLRIANDGAPFDPAKAPGAAEGHFGLAGMSERSNRLGAKVNIAVDGHWTVVSVSKE